MKRTSVFLLLACASPAFAQVDGHVSVFFDVLPNVASAAVMEMRTRLFVERKQDAGRHFRVNLSGYVDGLVADRKNSGGSGSSAGAILRPGDLYTEFISTHVEVRAGASRVVWGRLDEFQPTDVVNPIDLTRFVFEGRSQARLPVGVVRARAFLPRSSTLEGVVVPVFRPGRFDQLEERTSPFNLAAHANVMCPPVGLGPCRLLQRDRREPGAAWSNLQGGARFTSTAGRVDWAVSAYRGFQAFPTYTVEVIRGGSAPHLVESFPRFTMVGGDFETVRGPWGLRGEAAAFFEHEVQRIEGGAGLDRRAGDYRIAGNVLVSRDNVEQTDVTLVAAADRGFARETRTVRLFAVYDPREDTAFLRAISSVSLRDNVWVEGSAGLFAGSSNTTLGRLTRHDFLYARLKVFF